MGFTIVHCTNLTVPFGKFILTKYQGSKFTFASTIQPELLK
jgi:hypothetical protein